MNEFELFQTPDDTPEFGIGDDLFIADDGGSKVKVSDVQKKEGSYIYSVITDDVYQLHMHVKETELFKDKRAAMRQWEEMTAKRKPTTICGTDIIDRRRYEIFFAQQKLVPGYRGRHFLYDYALLTNGRVYLKEGPYAYVVTYPTSEKAKAVYIEKITKLKETNSFVMEQRLPKEEIRKTFQTKDGHYASWGYVRAYETPMAA